MSRRVVSAVLAVVLAVVGAILLIGYVSGADRRAMEGLKPVDVLVVSEDVPAGTPAEDLVTLVESATFPATAVVPGAIRSLQEVEGLVTTADLLAGEQLIAGRFGEPGQAGVGGIVDVPEDMNQISLLLEPQRVLGGHLQAGNRVEVVVSLADPDQTSVILRDVLVSRVQGGLAAPVEQAGEALGDQVVETPVMVTLVVSPGDAERVAFGAEHGTVWLALEGTESPDGGTALRARENIFQ